MRCGVPEKECNLGGSNAHYRNCWWRGTPEQCCELLGIKEVPAGIGTFNVSPVSASTPAKYRSDGYGDATHMGIYMLGGQTFNSSEKNGGVTIAVNFKGRKAVSGGTNMVGFLPWIDCGLTDAQMAALLADSNYTGSYDTQSTSATPAISTVAAAPDTSRYFTVKKGCKGGAVERLQSWLVDLGFTLKIDHDFGPTTEAIVKVFQRDHGLTVDGIVGQKTWAALAAARTAAMES